MLQDHSQRTARFLSARCYQIPAKGEDKAMPVLQDGLTPLHFAACNGHIEAKLSVAAWVAWVFHSVPSRTALRLCLESWEMSLDCIRAHIAP